MCRGEKESPTMKGGGGLRNRRSESLFEGSSRKGVFYFGRKRGGIDLEKEKGPKTADEKRRRRIRAPPEKGDLSKAEAVFRRMKEGSEKSVRGQRAGRGLEQSY